MAKDSNTIAFYLFFEELPDVLMVLYQVYGASQQLFQILRCQNMVVEFRGHGDKEVYIAPLAMLIASNGAKQPHGRNTKLAI